MAYRRTGCRAVMTTRCSAAAPRQRPPKKPANTASTPYASEPRPSPSNRTQKSSKPKALTPEKKKAMSSSRSRTRGELTDMEATEGYYESRRRVLREFLLSVPRFSAIPTNTRSPRRATRPPPAAGRSRRACARDKTSVSRPKVENVVKPPSRLTESRRRREARRCEIDRTQRR